MKGTSWIREQGMQDALLCAALRDREMDDVPLWQHPFPERDAAMKHWNDLVPRRDGPVAPERVEVADEAAMAQEIKRRARALGAADVGMTALKPEFVELGIELPHRNVIAAICYEDYRKSVESPQAVDLEAMSTYAKCADVATELARQIREEFGYPALAHHNGSFQIQAIPVFYEVGFGELGRHGSLIHPELGANFRPGFVTTDLPVAYDEPYEFGVQDYCMSCNLCRNNCPGDAIPGRLHRHRRHQALADRHRQVLSDLALPRGLLPYLRRRLPLYLQGERRRREARPLPPVHEDPEGGGL